ncbi:DsbA family oxidoreductase [Ornithinicoccus halotolerans]|uniref:DsbA family oxidoreductase n=1 Tax=Ornithinicoccus halotolerans TaxID=1748220 RepID=UPI001E65101E|nr:DsbA family oxidoreductase [Ornithinicoccus halotolerans]
MRAPAVGVHRGVKIDIWSDVVCPFCYLGKRHLELALQRFEHRDEVEVVWHSFELDPHAPAEDERPTSRMLAEKYGMTLEQARANNARLEQQAAQVGLEYHLEQARRGNTFDAHRLLHLAREEGGQGELQERLMRGYFTESLPVGDPATLVRLATEAGLEEGRVRAVLAGDEYAEAVRADEARARDYGATGVPFFVLAGRYGVSGAQPVELFERALAQSWADEQEAAAS